VGGAAAAHGGADCAGARIVQVMSRVSDRFGYLQRPDLGCELDDKSRGELEGIARTNGDAIDVAVIVADGLSALAAQLHAASVVEPLVSRLQEGKYRVGPVVLARFARVGLQDEIGHLLGARASVILLGERPGLGTADSLGGYLVFNPRPGNTNAERNCVSNIRPAGLQAAVAVETLYYLISESLRRQISGVELKDEREATSRRMVDHVQSE
jgi:ethanolamine ammonia-lyase small subunit